jgi:hypothetical protein
MAKMTATNVSLNLSAILATGTKTHTPPGMNFPGIVGKFDTVNLPTGNTTVSPPASTLAIAVIMPPTTGIVTIKGVAGDTGIPVANNSTVPLVFLLPLATTTFVVNCTVAITGIEIIYLG